MNMFLHELKSYRKSTFIWTCSLAALIILFLSLYPAFTTDVASVKKLLGGLPEGIRKAFGIVLDNFFTLIGFYSYIFTYVVLCGSIQAMNLGTSIVSKEVRENTADFLLTKPVSRRKIMTAKLLAIVSSLAITDVIYLIVAGIMVSAVKSGPYSMKIFLMISATLFFVQIIFLALGVLVSVIVPKIRSVLPISLGTVFGFYILNLLDSLVGDKAMRYVIPFLYYDSAYIIKNASYETIFIIIEIVFIITAIAASYLVYSKKDIHAI